MHGPSSGYILSVFKMSRMSVHPDTISVNDSRLREKSNNIVDILVRRRYIDDIVD